jgi:hypothetical protein
MRLDVSQSAAGGERLGVKRYPGVTAWLEAPRRIYRDVTTVGDPDARFDAVLAACSLGLGLFSFCTLAAVAYLSYNALPWLDAWAHWIGFLATDDRLTFLFSQHNEHRIPVSRLLYLADHQWFNADARLLLWSTMAAQTGSAIVLYKLAASSPQLRPVHRVQVFGVILALSFSASQWNNFTWTFQVCFVVVFFSAIAAFAALSRAVRRPESADREISRFWVCAAIVMGLIATGSMANGLLVWPLMVLMSLWIGLPNQVTGLVAAIGTTVSWLYMRGYQPGGFVPADSLMKTPETVAFALAYLGVAVDEPFVAVTRALGLDWTAYRVATSALAGAVGVLCFLRFAVLALSRPAQMGASATAMLHILAFLASSALLTAIGRVRFGLVDALTSRYATPSLLFWACLTGLALAVTNAHEHAYGTRGSSRRLLVAALAGAVFVGGLIQLPKVTYAMDSRRYLNEGEHAVVNNVFAAEAWERFLPAPGRMIPVVRYFRSRHLSSFSSEWTQWIGEPVRAHFILSHSDSDCAGEWESVSPAGGSFSPAVLAAGWGYDRRFGRAPQRVVFTDGQRRIVGFAGSTTRRRPDLVSRHPEVAGLHVGWVSYLPAGLASEITAYVLIGDGQTLCRAGSASIPGAYFTADAAKAGDAVEGVEASPQGAWMRVDGTMPEPAGALDGGTWSSRAVEAGTATLRLGPVTAKAGRAFGLPLSTGPNASGVHVSAIERGTGEVLTAASPPAGKSAWHLWRLDIPDGAPAMVFDYVIEHAGGGAGNWVLVGRPREINP